MSGNQNMRTPKWVFEAIQTELGIEFTLDAAADDLNAMCEWRYTKDRSGLANAWSSGWSWCNPPFSEFTKWIAWAWTEWAKHGRSSVLLGPAGCSQSWFHEHAKGGTVYVPDCRINYLMPDGKPTTAADRDTMIYAFGDQFANTAASGWRVLPFPLKKYRSEKPGDRL